MAIWQPDYRVNRFPDLKYVLLEVKIKYVANMKLKRLIIEKNSGPHFEIQNWRPPGVNFKWLSISRGSQYNNISLYQVWYTLNYLAGEKLKRLKISIFRVFILKNPIWRSSGGNFKWLQIEKDGQWNNILLCQIWCFLHETHNSSQKACCAAALNIPQTNKGSSICNKEEKQSHLVNTILSNMQSHAVNAIINNLSPNSLLWYCTLNIERERVRYCNFP